jgi:hypothetical protein
MSKGAARQSGEAHRPHDKKENRNMTKRNYAPGGDAKIIAEIAKRQFGNFTAMFERHGWPERGSDMMRKVQTRVVDRYGSVKAFEARYVPEHPGQGNG